MSCTECSGSGEVCMRQFDGLTVQLVLVPCPVCGGDGEEEYPIDERGSD